METNCSICLKKIAKLGKLNLCSHTFCVSCINSWSKISNRCPICRTVNYKIQISNEKIIKISPLKTSETLNEFLGGNIHNGLTEQQISKIFFNEFIIVILLLVVFVSLY